MAGLLFHGVQELPAGLLATPAGLGADPAVLVHPGMPFALIAAAPADGNARLAAGLFTPCVVSYSDGERACS
jgi:hypothetical protein